MSALTQEQAKLRQGLKLEVDNVEVKHLRSVKGGEIRLSVVDVTTSVSKQQESSTGRSSFSPLVFSFANSKATVPLIEKVCKYYMSPQTEKRSTITLTELDRAGTAGAQINMFECFCTKLELPKGNNQEGVLITNMEWSIHRVDHVAGGIK
jgi:hypothetical protein